MSEIGSARWRKKHEFDQLSKAPRVSKKKQLEESRARELDAALDNVARGGQWDVNRAIEVAIARGEKEVHVPAWTVIMDQQFHLPDDMTLVPDAGVSIINCCIYRGGQSGGAKPLVTVPNTVRNFSYPVAFQNNYVIP